MKVLVKCDNCNEEVELSPVTVGKHAYVGRNLNEHNMNVFEVTYDYDTSLNADQDFLGKLAKANSKEEVETILEDDIDYNTSVETSVRDLRIDCQNCGEYIVLTEFD